MVAVCWIWNDTVMIVKRRKLTPNDKKLARTLKGLRVERGLSQEELAGRMGANLSYIAYVETLRRGMSLPMVYKAAQVLGVKVKDLFEV